MVLREFRKLSTLRALSFSAWWRYIQWKTSLNSQTKKGNILPDVWLLPEGSTAKNLAEAIHADLAKGFLYAVDARTKQRIARQPSAEKW